MTNNNQNKINKQNQPIEEIDIKELIIKILKKWYVFVIVGILSLTFAIYHIFSTPPTFTTSGTVLIRSNNNLEPSILGDEFSMASDIMNIGKDVNDEMIVLKSKNITKQMVEELNLQTSAYYKKRLGSYYQLYNNEPLVIIFPDGYKKNLTGSLTIEVEKNKKGIWKFKFIHKLGYNKTKFKGELSDLTHSLETPWGKFSFIEDASKIDPDYPNYELRYVTIPAKSRIEEYNATLNISLSNKKANAINITLNGGNIAKNEAIINKIIELYDRDALSDKNRMARQMSKFIDERIEVLSKELVVIENEVEQYRVKEGLADFSVQAKLAIEASKEYEQMLTEVDMEYNLMTFIENHILQSDILDLIPSNTGIDNQALTALIMEYNNQVMEYLRLTRSTNENNPFVSQLKDKILMTRQNILQTITNIKEGTKIRREDVIKRSNLLAKDLSGVPTIEKEYVEIAREQGIKRNLYLFLLRKREDIQLNLASNINTSKIVDNAYTSERPIAPNKKLILLIAIFLTGVIGLAYVYIESLVNNKVEDKKMLNSLTNLPILGTIPFIKDKSSNIVMREGANDIAAERFRGLRTNLKFTFNKPDDKVIILTSSHSGEGKTFISINLALSLAMIDKKVALVGLDIRIPRLAEYMSINNTPGVTDFLSESAYTEDDIKQNYSNNLDVFVAGSIPPNPSELLTNPRLVNLFEYLRNNYDYVIIDSAPIGLTSDTLHLSQYSDANLYVCRQKVTTKEEIQHLNHLVENDHISNISLILNGTSGGNTYGYGYGYGYGQFNTKK
jgi:capsular exopolysaccharide synthesis family protein